MKPVIIYTFPRSKSTATLEACLRDNKFNEPFSEYRLFNIDYSKANVSREVKEKMYSDSHVKINNLYATYFDSLDKKSIDQLLTNLNDQNSVSKIFGFHLTHFLPGRKWFSEADKNNTHDIFVLIRDLREQMLSYLLAPKFGYFINASIPPYETIINDSDFYSLRTNIDSFLRFFPTNAKLISFENLPDSHFNKTNIKLGIQNSLDNLKYIKNLNECEDHISKLISYFKDEWEDKVNRIK